MTDPKKEAAMSVLSSLFALSLLVRTSRKNLIAATLLRMTRMSCLHGLSPHSPFGIAGSVSIQVTLGDFGGAKETTRIAVDLNDRIDGADAFAGRTQSLVGGLISPWLEGKSLVDIPPELIRSFHTAIAHGDVDQGFYGTLHHPALGLVRGVPIDELNADFEKYIRGLDDYQVHQVKGFTLSIWRPIRMLFGKGDRTTDDDSIDVTGLYGSVKTSPENRIHDSCGCHPQSHDPAATRDVRQQS